MLDDGRVCSQGNESSGVIVDGRSHSVDLNNVQITIMGSEGSNYGDEAISGGANLCCLCVGVKRTGPLKFDFSIREEVLLFWKDNIALELVVYIWHYLLYVGWDLVVYVLVIL